MPFSKKIERGNVCNYNKALKDRLVSPSNNILDLDLNHVESNNNSKCIFPLSLGTYNNALNSKPVSPPLFEIASKDYDHWLKRFEPCD